MLNLIIGLVVGLIVGWNFFPQPAVIAAQIAKWTGKTTTTTTTVVTPTDTTTL